MVKISPELVTGPEQVKSSGRIAKRRQKNNSSRHGMHEKNSRIHLDRLQNRFTNCKGAKDNTNFGQITGIQEKLDTTCK